MSPRGEIYVDLNSFPFDYKMLLSIDMTFHESSDCSEVVFDRES